MKQKNKPTLDEFIHEEHGVNEQEEEKVDVSSELPKGWKWTRLGNNDLAEIIMGQSPPSATYNKEGIGLPFYQGKADFGELYPTPRTWCSKPKKIAEVGDILISVRAPVGPVNLCKEKYCIGRGLAAIRPKNHVLDNLFLFYYLRSIEGTWKGKGSTFKAIKKKDLQNLRVPLPPLQEQKRIVARIEKFLSRVNKAKKLHEETGKILENISRVVLHRAFKGEL